MIVKQFFIGSTEILVDDTYYPKTEEEKRQRYEDFNEIGNKILRMENKIMNQINL